MDNHRCEQRLQELKTRFEDGQIMPTDLEPKQTTLKRILLRICGSIPVFEELPIKPQSASHVTLQTSTWMAMNSAEYNAKRDRLLKEVI